MTSNQDAYRPLKMGEKIRNGDFFLYKGGWFAATDVGTGVMSSNHYPHFRFVVEADCASLGNED